MSTREKRSLQIWVIMILVANGFALASAVLVGNIVFWLVILGGVIFDLYWVYIRYFKRRRPHYPMVPSDGKADVYFPSSNIPRPIVAEARQFGEKKKRFRKIRRRLKRVGRKKT